MRKTKTKNLKSKSKKGGSQQPERYYTMKSHITYSFSDNTLSLTKSFYKKACKVGTPEYKKLCDAFTTHPDAKIVFIENANKRTYAKLTFERMVAYIKTQANSEDNLRTMERVMLIAEAKGAKYPLTKKWFLETFPEYQENSVSESERNNMDAKPSNSKHEQNKVEDVSITSLKLAN